MKISVYSKEGVLVSAGDVKAVPGRSSVNEYVFSPPFRVTINGDFATGWIDLDGKRFDMIPAWRLQAGETLEVRSVFGNV